MRDTDLTERRTEAETKLEELRAQRGAATLDGNSFGNAEISSLEKEVSALYEAEGVQVQREREAASAEWLKNIDKRRKELSALESKRLGEIQDMNTAARALAEAIEANMNTTQKMAKAAHSISGISAPIPLNAPANASRLSARLSAIMSAIPGSPHRWGSLEWLGSSLYSPADNWRIKEAELFDVHLSPILGKEIENDKS